MSLPSEWTYVMSMDSPPHLEACPPNKAYTLQISTGTLKEIPNLDRIANDFINTFQKDNYKFSYTDKIFFNDNEYRKLVFSSVQEEKYLTIYLTYKKKTLCCITVEGKNETFNTDAQTIEKIISSLKLVPRK